MDALEKILAKKMSQGFLNLVKKNMRPSAWPTNTINLSLSLPVLPSLPPSVSLSLSLFFKKHLKAKMEVFSESIGKTCSRGFFATKIHLSNTKVNMQK